MKRIDFAIISIFVMTIFVISGCANKEIMMVRQMEIKEIELSSIPDGNYKGDFTYGSFTYELEVIVKNHRIENVKVLKNRDDEHAKKAEGVIKRVVESQSLKVDAISGATTTSKAFLKAIENALRKISEK